jgi:5'-nucleotidase
LTQRSVERKEHSFVSFQLLASTEKLKFLDEVETVNDEARRLKAKGVDIIVVLSHCGLDVDRRMAAECPLIDVIVGGHSHSFLYTGLYVAINTFLYPDIP